MNSKNIAEDRAMEKIFKEWYATWMFSLVRVENPERWWEDIDQSWSSTHATISSNILFYGFKDEYEELNLPYQSFNMQEAMQETEHEWLPEVKELVRKWWFIT